MYVTPQLTHLASYLCLNILFLIGFTLSSHYYLIYSLATLLSLLLIAAAVSPIVINLRTYKPF